MVCSAACNFALDYSQTNVLYMTKRFKQTTKNGLLYIGMACMMLLAGCVEKDIYEGPEENGPTKEDFFDFSTTGFYTLDVNYGLNDYSVLFELYTSNPMTTTDGLYTKAENIRPVYRAATDKAGKFKGEISLPAYVKSVYLYCHYLGTVRCAELAINGSTISFDQDTYLAGLSTRSGVTTRATTPQGYTIPDGYLTLGKWGVQGNVDYLADTEKLPGDFLSRLNKSMVKDASKKNKDFVAANPSPDINITQPTKLSTAIVSSDAAHEVTVGYFTYPTGQVPSSPAEIKNPIIMFPAVASSTGNADPGHEVAMKYWNGTSFEDEFPAGVSVSFFFMVGAFEKNVGDIKIYSGKELEGVKDLGKNVDYIFYSNSSLNQKMTSAGQTDAQRTITMYDDKSGLAAICFEGDLKKAFTVGSWDYADVIMAVRLSESATDTSFSKLTDEKGEPTNEENYYGLSGTIAFEDLWPSKGDYDMNDMVIYYNSTVYKDVNTNKVIKTVDEIYAQHSGASYVNGFGYQFHKISSNAIANVTIATESGLSSAFMGGSMLEPGQEHPTIILFDNMNEAAKTLASFTVTTEFSGSGVNEMDVLPPYNPFLIAQTTNGRGREVHLTNYPPTTLADRSLLGSSDDLSNPNIGLYYVSTQNYPFALCLDSEFFAWPEETVSIDKAYPDFTKWVESKGASHPDWYRK